MRHELIWATATVIVVLASLTAFVIARSSSSRSVRLEMLRAEVERVLRYDPNEIGAVRGMRELRQQYQRLYGTPENPQQ